MHYSFPNGGSTRDDKSERGSRRSINKVQLVVYTLAAPPHGDIYLGHEQDDDVAARPSRPQHQVRILTFFADNVVSSLCKVGKNVNSRSR